MDLYHARNVLGAVCRYLSRAAQRRSPADPQFGIMNLLYIFYA